MSRIVKIKQKPAALTSLIYKSKYFFCGIWYYYEPNIPLDNYAFFVGYLNPFHRIEERDFTNIIKLYEQFLSGYNKELLSHNLAINNS